MGSPRYSSRRDPSRFGHGAAVIGGAILVLFVATPLEGQVKVSARLEPARVAEGATADLVVEISGAGALARVREPEVPSLPDLVIVGTSRETHVQMDRGGVSRSTVFRYRLQAGSAGARRIDPIRVVVDGDTHTTSPLRLTVVDVQVAREGRRDADNGLPGFFAVTRVDRDRVYVGEQLTLTFAFYHDPRAALAESPDYDPPETPGFWRVELDPNPEVSTERIGGRTYHVQRFHYALFPLRPGEYTVGPAAIRIVEPDPRRWWLPGDSRALTTEPLRVVADSLPEGAPPDFSGAVGRFEISGGLDKRRAVAGGPVELTVTVSGEGNPSAIPPPALPAWPEVEVRSPSVEVETEPAHGRVRGQKTFRYLIVPESPGGFSLGHARLAFFDPTEGKYAVDTLRLGEIEVIPGRIALQPATETREFTGPTLWAPETPRSRVGSMVVGSAWFWVALTGPWLGWLAAAFAARTRPTPDQRARREAIQRLERAGEALASGLLDASGEAGRALDEAIARIYGIRPAATVPRKRAEHLESVGVPPDISAEVERALRLLAETEYSGELATAAVESLERVRALLQVEPAVGRSSALRSGLRMGVVVAVAALLVAGLAMVGSRVVEGRIPGGSRDSGSSAGRLGSEWSMEGEGEGRADIWAGANDAYRSGEFLVAAEAYQRLLEERSDARVEANLAASLWRAGARGRAVGHYRRALLIDPRNGEARRDLDGLRKELGYPEDGSHILGRALDRIRLDELLVALLAIGSVTFAAAVALRGRRRTLLMAGVPAISAIAVVALIHGATVGRQGQVVIVESAVIAAEPGGAAIASIPEGTVVDALEIVDQAVRIRGDEQPAGWVAKDRTMPLH